MVGSRRWRDHCPAAATLPATEAPSGHPATADIAMLTPTGLHNVLPGAPSRDERSLLETIVRDVAGEHGADRLTSELPHRRRRKSCAGKRAARSCWCWAVMGTIEAVLGSVSQYRLRQATCPVLVIPIQLANSNRRAEPIRQVPGSRTTAVIHRPQGDQVMPLNHQRHRFAWAVPVVDGYATGRRPVCWLSPRTAGRRPRSSAVSS